MTLCVELNFAQSFLLNKKVEFEPSFLPIGKLGKKTSPVDCEITLENYFFEPKIKFTQTAAWHGIRVELCQLKHLLRYQPHRAVRSICERRFKISEVRESFTDDSLMCGEEATLSRRRLSGENLLCTFSIPKSGGIGLRMAVNYLFPLKSSNNPPSIKYLFHFSIPKSRRIELHMAVNYLFPPKIL